MRSFFFFLQVRYSTIDLNSWSTAITYCSFLSHSSNMQGRREPNVGPTPAQMWRNCGFVKSKTDGENAVVWSEKWCDLKKKKNSTVFPAEIKWSPKQNKTVYMRLRWAFHFSMSFGWAPLELMGPGVIVPPSPLPSRRPWQYDKVYLIPVL